MSSRTMSAIICNCFMLLIFLNTICSFLYVNCLFTYSSSALFVEILSSENSMMKKIRSIMTLVV